MTNNVGGGRPKIRLDDPEDVRTWLDRYGCSEEQLVTAVKAVGPLAPDVREFLALEAKRRLKRTSVA